MGGRHGEGQHTFRLPIKKCLDGTGRKVKGRQDKISKRRVGEKERKNGGRGWIARGGFI